MLLPVKACGSERWTFNYITVHKVQVTKKGIIYDGKEWKENDFVAIKIQNYNHNQKVNENCVMAVSRTQNRVEEENLKLELIKSYEDKGIETMTG